MEAPVRDPQNPPSTDVAELHLLIEEMGDELTAYRWREAVWVSLVVHAVVVLALIFVPKWIPKGAIIIPFTQSNKDSTFLLAPSDQLHVKPPKTDITSDKNRIAQSRTPTPNKDLLRKLLDAQRPGPPARTQQPAPSQQAAQQTPAQASPQQQAGAQDAPQAPQQPTETAQLHTPAPGGGPSPFKTQAPGIQQAIQSVANSHGTSRLTFGGDYGSARLQPNTNMRGDVEILSDTMGVDFGPYLQRVLYTIKKNWYNLIPEVARPPLMKKGKLIIQFAILKDGRVAGMVLQAPSGDIYLDRAAWGGITGSDPFDRLPPEFGGNYLALRIKFIYNSTTDDLN